MNCIKSTHICSSFSFLVFIHNESYTLVSAFFVSQEAKAINIIIHYNINI